MKLFLNFLILVFLLGCQKDTSSSCDQLSISEVSFTAEKNQLRFSWEGHDYVSLEILDKNTGIITEQFIENNNAIFQYAFDYDKKYELAVYIQCYKDGNYTKRLYKRYNLNPCNEFVRDYKITQKENGEYHFDINPKIENVDYSLRFTREDGYWIETIPSDISLLPGFVYDVEIKTKCTENLGKEQFYADSIVRFKLDTGRSVLSNELSTSCRPMSCDTLNVPLLIPAEKNSELRYISYHDNLNVNDCQIHYHKIVSKSNTSKSISFFMTSEKHSNGEFTVYYKDDFCGKVNIPMQPVGQSVLVKNFGANEIVTINFYKSYYDIRVLSDFEVFRKRVF